ncbi:MAG: hypothetical protein JSW62_01215 [Thermoplasmatales archaeon]|nr:MAG: hypothetical protein JSW62_01215 [Thermoplasmatales archaeon]
MNAKKCYENYPFSFVIGANVLQLAIYLIGAYIVYLLGPVWFVLYVVYVLILEIRLLKISCIHCYYYSKRCAFGKGKLCAIFFKKGYPEKFIEKQIGWIDIIPDFLVSIIPLIIGVLLLIIDFDWFILLLIVLLVFLAFPINGFMRGSLACKYCKQREIGCPAEKLFSKKKSVKER